jgi:hypothetical protein
MLKPFNEFLSEQRLDEIVAKVRRRVTPVSDVDLKEVIRDALRRAGVGPKSEDGLKNHAAMALIFDGITRLLVDRFKKFGLIQPGPELLGIINDIVKDMCPWAHHNHVLQRTVKAIRIIQDALRVHHGTPRVVNTQKAAQ